MPNLYVVATPIGNLNDISPRAVETLKGTDLILCEDTRVTNKLLVRYGITVPALSYHQHSDLTKINYILEILGRGKNLAIVSDAGTPGISDPGNRLVDEILKKFGKDVNIIPIPGPTALAAAASISGLPMDKFLFLGFPPAKKKRNKFFEEIVRSDYAVIFYESPHRIIRTLEDLKSIFSISSINKVKIIVFRELTKKFETVYRGNFEGVIDEIKKNPVKGEFTVIVKKLSL